MTDKVQAITSQIPTDQLTSLEPAIASKVLEHCEQGYTLFDRGEIKASLRKFYSAWNLLPKPQTDWQESGWVLTALGDAYFAKGEFRNGQQALLSALHCPKGFGNPIIHIRLGQCEFELGDMAAASQQFKNAVEHGGEDLLKQLDSRYREQL